MTCQEDVIASFDNTHYETDLYIANNVIDRMNYKFPNNTFIDNIYWPLAPLVYKVSNILIDRVTMQNFNDYLSYTSYENQTFYSTDMAHIKEMITWRTEAESTILQWNLRKSIQNKVIIRTYPKIQEFLTDLGGFSKALMFISAFIAIGYLRYSYKTNLANELYDFEIPDKPSQKPLLEKSSFKSQTYNPMIFDFTQSKITDYDAVLSPKATLNQKSILLSPKSPNELSNKTVINYFESEKRRKKLKVNEISYFRSLIEPIFCWKRKRDHDKYASKGLDFVANDIDISNLIKKLGEIEKLKVLLLNKNQRDCLELWGKSVISLDNQNATHRDSLFVSQISQPIQTAEETQDKAAISSSEFSPETFNSLPKYGKLYIAYKALKYSKDSDIQTQLYNKKLLKMINPSLVNVFRRAEQILANDQQFEEAMRQILDGQTMVLFNHLITQNNSLV